MCSGQPHREVQSDKADLSATQGCRTTSPDLETPELAADRSDIALG